MESKTFTILSLYKDRGRFPGGGLEVSTLRRTMYCLLWVLRPDVPVEPTPRNPCYKPTLALR